MKEASLEEMSNFCDQLMIEMTQAQEEDEMARLQALRQPAAPQRPGRTKAMQGR